MDTHTPIASAPLLMRAAEVADTLSISERSVRKLAAAGALPVIRVAGTPRFRRADVEAFVAGIEPEASR